MRRVPFRYWESQDNQRKFLEHFAVQNNINHPHEWGKVSVNKVKGSGGSFLNEYRGSLRKALQNLFKEINWEDKWFSNISHRPSGFWKDKNNQRNFIAEIATKLNIKKSTDWSRITKNDIIALGGSSLLSEYQGSFSLALKSLFPKMKLENNNFPIAPKGYWHHKENQRKFLDSFALKYGIKSPEDWGMIWRKQIIKEGGYSVLSLNENSLYSALKRIYPEISWKSEWFQKGRGYWFHRDNQRIFLQKFGEAMKIQKPSDWGRIKLHELLERGALPLYIMHEGSLFKLLQNVFPEMEWKEEWFIGEQKAYWKVKSHQIAFLEEIARKEKIKKRSDWGKLSKSRFMELGGFPLLKLYKGSIFLMLSSIYDEIHWERSWFPSIPRYQNSYWNSLSNQRTFLDELSYRYGIVTIGDWKRISISLLQRNGGRGLLAKYHYSIYNMLESVFPHWNWKLNALNSSEDQQTLLSSLQ